MLNARDGESPATATPHFHASSRPATKVNVIGLTLAYDPATDGWSSLPAPPDRATGGAAGACGLFRIGGFSNQVEQLPGFDNCHTDTDVPWLAVGPATTTLQPGQSGTFTVEFAARRQAPVMHRAAITITDDTPYSPPPVPVVMHVTSS